METEVFPYLVSAGSGICKVFMDIFENLGEGLVLNLLVIPQSDVSVKKGSGVGQHKNVDVQFLADSFVLMMIF